MGRVCLLFSILTRTRLLENWGSEVVIAWQFGGSVLGRFVLHLGVLGWYLRFNVLAGTQLI